MTPAELEQALMQFTGTEKWTRHGMARRLLLMTDGVMFLQEEAKAYWLIDAIASHLMTNAALRREEFQAWTFTRHGEGLAKPNQPHLLIATDGNDHELVRQEIEFTDFQLPEIKLYVAWDGGSFNAFVAMLPSEY